MELNEQQKRTALTAFWQHRPGTAARVYAAVAAVLAEQPRAAEQPKGYKQTEVGEYGHGRKSKFVPFSEQPTQQPAGDVVERGSGEQQCVNEREAKLIAEVSAAKKILARGETSDEHRSIGHLAYAACAAIDNLVAQREGMVSLDAVEHAIIEQGNTPGGWPEFTKAIRARLSPKQPEPRERVECFPMHPGNTWAVVVDKNRDHPDSAWNLKKKVAELYAAGLREELKAGNK